MCASFQQHRGNNENVTGIIKNTHTNKNYFLFIRIFITPIKRVYEQNVFISTFYVLVYDPINLEALKMCLFSRFTYLCMISLT